MKACSIVIFMFFSNLIIGQISIDKSILLQGSQPVEGLSNPQSGDEAMTAGTLQAGSYLYAEASGTNALVCTLDPNPASILPGTSLYLLVDITNTDSVELSVNGFPSVPIRKNAVNPLDSGDLIAGSVVQLIYDGVGFQLLTLPYRDKRPCLAGMVEINSQYCIEIDERPALDFPDAAEVCGNIGGKLCSWAEFSIACHADTVYGVNNMTGNYEWTNTAGNGDNLVRIVGWNNCRSAGTNFAISSTPRPYRCCYRR